MKKGSRPERIAAHTPTMAAAQSVTSKYEKLNWGHQLEVTAKREQLATVPRLFVR